MKKSTPLCMMVLLPCFMFQIASGASTSDTVWGPENQGLRMNLNIENANPNQADVYKVTIRLANVGKTPIELVAQWSYEDDKGDYNEYFKTIVGLTSFPEIKGHVAQTLARAPRTSLQPTLEIKPNDMVTFEWITAKRLLKPNGFYNNLPDIFPSDGLYSIRAGFLANTKQGDRILLYSNDFQLSVGKSNALPKFALARIIQSNPDQNTVILNVGSYQKIEPNDIFQTIGKLSWDILITEVKDNVSTGSVKLKGRNPEGNRYIPDFPKEGSFAALVPAGARR